METKELIGDFRKELDHLESQGTQQVHVAALRKYLDAQEKSAGMSQELRDRVHAGALAHYAAQTSHSLEMVKAVLETGKSALHALLLVHGGAAVAVLGVLSNLVGKSDGAALARYLALPLLQFGIGVLVGAVGFALRYLSQACYTESEKDTDKWHRWGDRFRNGAILTALAGYVLFGVAVVNAYQAVSWTFAR